MKKLIFSLLLLAFAFPAFAHLIDYQLDKLDDGDIFWKYLKIGYEHIIPLGIDHILFIMCVFFLNTSLKSIIWQASMFTLAHSITLGLAMYQIIDPPPAIVEPIIALSIVLLALENIFFKKVMPWRMVMVFIFGLVHGMGFAGALSELGMPRYAFANALISFNVGVELGQITVILLLYFLVSLPFSKFSWYRRGIVIPISIFIALLAGYWTVERFMNV